MLRKLSLRISAAISTHQLRICHTLKISRMWNEMGSTFWVPALGLCRWARLLPLFDSKIGLYPPAMQGTDSSVCSPLPSSGRQQCSTMNTCNEGRQEEQDPVTLVEAVQWAAAHRPPGD